MKKIINTFVCCLLLSSLFAQKIITKNLPFSSGQKVDLNLRFGENILISGWDKNEVGVRISVDINNNKLNEAFLANFSSNSNTISVSTDFDKNLIKNANCGDCGDSTSSSSWGNQRICTKIRYEIFLPRNAPLNVETISADMEIVNFEGPLHAKNISGFIDMSLPHTSKADIFMKSITGECYSDMNLAIDRQQSTDPVGVKIEGKLNGGGIPLELETISSNIYLRKKKQG